MGFRELLNMGGVEELEYKSSLNLESLEVELVSCMMKSWRQGEPAATTKVGLGYLRGS
jgi:hypothetical protein